MSELINNREYRVDTIKKILAQLHEGKTVDEVKSQFAEAFEGVSAEEISQAEQALVNEGMPVEEIQNLCDVHAEVFKGSIEEIHSSKEPEEAPGHPANVLKLENRALEKLMEDISTVLERAGNNNGSGEAASGAGGNLSDFVQKAAAMLKQLYHGLDLHYKKKENLFFPYMEQYGISAPPKVMWGVDDEIRGMLKEVMRTVESGTAGAERLRADAERFQTDAEELQTAMKESFGKIADMIFKEENILLGILQENLTQDEWKQIADDSSDFGYCLIENPGKWTPAKSVAHGPSADAPGLGTIGTNDKGLIQLPTGSFTVQELTAILDTLPVDITFVGKDDTVRYFSQSSERIFHRTPSVIGRQVSNCHPPASVHIVEKLVEDFKNGTKNSEDFWIRMGDKFVLIRYFAVRDQSGEYLGVLEVTQNIAPIQEITGEKRLVQDL